MTNATQSLFEDLKSRNLVSQITPSFEEHLTAPRTLYCGFDPTADSLHIGHLVPLLILRRFQQAGHKPIVLVGGATGMIGDPSFRAQERKLNTEETVKEWSGKLKAQMEPFVSFEGENAAVMANNYEWTHSVSILHFLRDVGKHFSVNNLIAKDAIRARLEREDSGISFTEFSYPLLQAFDFQQLKVKYNCTVQVGGSDQWGNMTAGTELIRKTGHGEAHVMTLPLVTKADGTKFGKSETGTIWLNAEKTSPYAFYQFWLNTADADVENFMLYFSFRPVAEIKALCEEHRKAPEKRAAQIALAEDVTRLIHGEQALEAAKRISAALFGGDLTSLTETDYAQLAQDGLPTVRSSGINLLAALGETKLAASNREARDFLKGNAVQVNGEVVTDEKLELTKANARFEKYHLLKRGKKLFALLVLE